MAWNPINLIPNPDFGHGELGGLPESWTMYSPQPYLAPYFALTVEEGRKVLSIKGNGDENCIGWIAASFPMEGGHTYRLTVRFHASSDVNPYKNLLFSFFSDNKFNDGIFEFRKIADNEFEGEGKFFVPGSGRMTGEVRLAYRLMAEGYVRIFNTCLELSDLIPERNVRIACFQGFTADIGTWEHVIDIAAANGADLSLLPETFTGDDAKKVQQPIDGECGCLMERKAKQHQMYVSGTFIHRDKADGHLYNTGLLFDRQGVQIGRYDKIHPYSPEFMHDGVTPGNAAPVFNTDFGTVGMMICYDSWFTDVAELVALKGAEVLLFPNAGYYRSLMPARANDNGLRIVSSSMYGGAGVWDTSGADVERPDMDPTRSANNDRTFKDVVRIQAGKIEMLLTTLDLNQSPSAHNWGGPMMSAPGGRRNRREQKRLLYDEIQAEINRRSIERDLNFSQT